jgi:DNA replication protein DnaC
MQSFKSNSVAFAAEKEDDDCVKSESPKELAEQRDQATALLQTCRRHVQLQSSAASPAQLAALLNEAAATYEKLGDRKALQDCRNVMTQFTNNAGGNVVM